MNAEGATLLTRDAFERQRAAVKLAARRDGRVLAFLSVGLGVAQLILLRWAEAHVARGPRIAIAGSAFLVYIMLIGFLWRRMKRRLRSIRPVCPQCGVALQGMSERVASATGKCDSCGGWILEQKE